MTTPSGPYPEHELQQALLAAQSEIVAEGLHFNATNPHLNKAYANLPAVLRLVIPRLNTHGVRLEQTSARKAPEPEDVLPVLTVTTKLIHSGSGEFHSFDYDTEYEPRAHGRASGFTYGKRYALCGFFGIAADSDDDEGYGADSSKIRGQELTKIVPRRAVTGAETFKAAPKATAKKEPSKAEDPNPHRVIPAPQQDITSRARDHLLSRTKWDDIQTTVATLEERHKEGKITIENLQELKDLAAVLSKKVLEEEADKSLDPSL